VLLFLEAMRLLEHVRYQFTRAVPILAFRLLFATSQWDNGRECGGTQTRQTLHTTILPVIVLRNTMPVVQRLTGDGISTTLSR
jgi:hypothetical protein